MYLPFDLVFVFTRAGLQKSVLLEDETPPINVDGLLQNVVKVVPAENLLDQPLPRISEFFAQHELEVCFNRETGHMLITRRPDDVSILTAQYS